MNSITILLPNTKANTYRIVTIIIALMNAIATTYFHAYLAKQGTIDYYFSAVGYIFILPSLTSYFIYKKGRSISMGSIALGNFLAAIVWWTIGTWFLGMLSMLFSILGWYALQSSFTLIINSSGIVYPSFPKKIFQWSELDNVILKDNVLTIDCKNNKLIQLTLNQSDNKYLNEYEVNAFVASKILHQ